MVSASPTRAPVSANLIQNPPRISQGLAPTRANTPRISEIVPRVILLAVPTRAPIPASRRTRPQQDIPVQDRYPSLPVPGARQHEQPETARPLEEAANVRPPVLMVTRSRKASNPTYIPRRREVQGECPICIESMENGVGLVWCKAQCGQNFHSECIRTWLASQIYSSSRKTCPYW